MHRAGVGRLLLRAKEERLGNVRIICHDVVEVLRSSIADEAFDSILIFFPDPWHKKRHHKRRLIDAAFVEMLTDKLRGHGVLRLATDWQALRRADAAGVQRLSPPGLAERRRQLCYAARSFAPRPDSSGGARGWDTACGIWLTRRAYHRRR